MDDKQLKTEDSKLKAEEEPSENVVVSEAKQSDSETEIATEPSAPRNDDENNENEGVMDGSAN